MTDHVVIQHEETTRIVKMRRPDKKNALTQDRYFAISQAIDSVQDDPAIRCMIITGSSGVFTTGNDLKGFLAAGSNAEQQAFGTSGGSTLLNSLNKTKEALEAFQGFLGRKAG
jgi:enoyl-CoA hydratase/carnithine racemase